MYPRHSFHFSLIFCIIMVDVKCAVSCFGLPPDAETSDVIDHFSSAGTVKSVLLVRESHSNLCTGRGYVIFRTL